MGMPGLRGDGTGEPRQLWQVGCGRRAICWGRRMGLRGCESREKVRRSTEDMVREKREMYI